MTPEQKALFSEVSLYMKAMAQGDHEDRDRLKKRVIRQFASDRCTGSGKSCDEYEAFVTAEVGEWI